MLEAIQDGIQKLTPKNDAQRWLQSQALQISTDGASTRWLLLSRPANSASAVFVIVVIGWLTIVFTSFGLFAPRYLTVLLTLGVCAASVATALFLILELGSPLGGMIRLSAEPLRFALAQFGQ